MLNKFAHNLKSCPNKGFGIHSPFVFRFQREVLHPEKRLALSLYGESEKESNKILRLLLRIYTYYKVQDVFLLNEMLEKGFKKHQKTYDKQFEKGKKYQLVVMDASQDLRAEYLAERTFVVLTGNRTQILENCLRKKCNVFLDLYELGICIFNRGLSKQEFKLNL